MFPDITIFRAKLLAWLMPGEKVEADDGYKGEPLFIHTPSSHIDSGNMDALVQAADARGRHETVNRRFKQFGCLHQVYRHGIDNHGSVFRAVATITQLGLEHGGMPLYDVEYNANLI